MVLARALVMVAAAGLTLAGPAAAFRTVQVGGPVPAVTVDAGGGRTVAVPTPGRVTIVLFGRTGQAFSDEAAADLRSLAPALEARGASVVALAESDATRSAFEAFGVIVRPSTAVVDAGGVLRAYVPSRNSNYRTLVEAHTLRALGDISEAELGARLARVGEVHGQSAEGAQAAYKRATALAADRKFDEAAREFTQALALQPSLTEAHLGLGYARLESGDAAQALREFEIVLAKSPHSPGARVGIGIARIRLGRVDEGIRLLEEALVLNPEPVRGHYELGRAYEARGDMERAIHHYRWALVKLMQGRK